MRRSCTCALRRVLAVSSEQALQNVSKSRIPITSAPGATHRSTTTGARRSLVTSQACAYPRQATPFSSANQKASEGSGLEYNDAAEQISASQAETSGSNSKAESTSSRPSSSSSSSSSSASAWYLSETPATSSSSSSKSTTSASSSIPKPPHTLPNYLIPLWNHIYESPFIERETINFIDLKTVQENVSIENMDSSVSNWVDWVIVTSLKNGRERGIRGASDGVKIAMQECLKLFDEQLAASESSSLSSPSSPSSGSSPQTQTTTTVSKRKKRIPKVLVEGLEIKEPQWALIDGSKAVIHIMTKKARKTWQVEGVASDFSEVSREIDRIGDEEEDHQRDLRKEEISEHAHTGHGFGDKTGTSDSRRETGEFQPRL